MRKVLGVVVLAVAIVVAFIWYQGQVSGQVKAEMLSLVNRMELSADERADVRGLVEELHDGAYELARQVAQGSGKRYDTTKYLDELFAALQSKLRSAGKAALADKLAAERELVTLSQ